MGAKIKNKAIVVSSLVQGLFELAVVAAQASAAYILWFQGSTFMQAIASILATSAAIVAVDKFTKGK